MPQKKSPGKMSDIPPMAALCLVTVVIALVVGLTTGASTVILGSLSSALIAVAIWIHRAAQ
jgi:hypothetical protein